MFRVQPISAAQAPAIIEIQQLLYLYAYALDSRSYALLEEIFTPDAHLEMSSGVAMSPTQYRAMCERVLPTLAATQHVTTNVLVDVDGDRGRARAYYHAQHCREGLPEGNLLMMGGWVDDEVVLVDGRWRISSRRWNSVWSEGNAAVLG